MKKSILVTAAVLGLCAALSGCGGAGGDPSYTTVTINGVQNLADPCQYFSLSLFTPGADIAVVAETEQNSISNTAMRTPFSNALAEGFGIKAPANTGHNSVTVTFYSDIDLNGTYTMVFGASPDMSKSTSSSGRMYITYDGSSTNEKPNQSGNSISLNGGTIAFSGFKGTSNDNLVGYKARDLADKF